MDNCWLFKYALLFILNKNKKHNKHNLKTKEVNVTLFFAVSVMVHSCLT